MHKNELRAVFDQQAAGYDEQQQRLGPAFKGLYFLLEATFADLADDARILCVGLGTGAELELLALRFPHWHFTAVEPSAEMLKLCQRRAEQGGFSGRCDFHEGYLESMPSVEPYDAATCFLVSQFFTDSEARIQFFKSIAARLKRGGLLASADLSAESGALNDDSLLRVWLNMLFSLQVPAGASERIMAGWAGNVAILPPAELASIISDGGFGAPVQIYQAGLLHAWCAKRT